MLWVVVRMGTPEVSVLAGRREPSSVELRGLPVYASYPALARVAALGAVE